MLTLLACGKGENVPSEEGAPADAPVEGNVVAAPAENLPSEAILLEGPLKEKVQIPVETVTLESLKENFAAREVTTDFVLGFYPEEEIVYQDVTAPDKIALDTVRITHLKTGESQDVSLEVEYEYFYSAWMNGENLALLLYRDDGGADYVYIDPEGNQKRVEFDGVDSMTAYPNDEGLYIRYEEYIGDDQVDATLVFMPYEGDEAKEIHKGSFTLDENDVVQEGNFFMEFFAMDNTVGFQEISSMNEENFEVLGSYLWDLDQDSLYKVDFVDQLSGFFSGTPELMVDYHAMEGEDGLAIYKSDGDGYTPYVLEGYESDGYFWDANFLKDGRLVLDGDENMDFVDLETVTAKRISASEGTLLMYLPKTNTLYFKEDGDNIIYWGEVEK
ncbi:MAG: hypothetical protein Q4E76_05635 [Tissierellia bacterium]|nr:hypothetical protein [Tissierellia bacterium]